MAIFNLFNNNSIEQHTNAIANYLPEDETFLAKKISGTTLRNLLISFASQFRNVEQLLNLFTNELSPNEANYLIGEWESMVGIPDSCFTGTGDLESRQRDVLVKLASLNVQTANDFVVLADIFGVDVEIQSGGDGGFFFPASFPMAFISSAQDSKFIIIVKFLNSSPLESLVRCLFSKLIPSNCILIVLPAP